MDLPNDISHLQDNVDVGAHVMRDEEVFDHWRLGAVNMHEHMNVRAGSELLELQGRCMLLLLQGLRFFVRRMRNWVGRSVKRCSLFE